MTVEAGRFAHEICRPPQDSRTSRMCQREPTVLEAYRGRRARRTEKMQDAIVQLRRSRSRFARLGDHRAAVECLLEEALLFVTLEHPRALAVAQLGLARCRALPEPSRGVLAGKALAHLGHVHGERHEWADAAACLHRGLASSAFDRERLALVHCSLARACVGAGDLDRAIIHNRLALAVCVNDELVRGDIESALAATLSAAHCLDRATALLESSLARRARVGARYGRARLLLELAELELKRDRDAAALAFTSVARELAHDLGERATLATASTMHGRIAVRADASEAEVDGHYSHALMLLRALRLDRRLAEVSLEFGHVLELRGDEGRAIPHYRRAALLTA